MRMEPICGSTREKGTNNRTRVSPGRGLLAVPPELSLVGLSGELSNAFFLILT